MSQPRQRVDSSESEHDDRADRPPEYPEAQQPCPLANGVSLDLSVGATVVSPESPEAEPRSPGDVTSPLVMTSPAETSPPAAATLPLGAASAPRVLPPPAVLVTPLPTSSAQVMTSPASGPPAARAPARQGRPRRRRQEPGVPPPADGAGDPPPAAVRVTGRVPATDGGAAQVEAGHTAVSGVIAAPQMKPRNAPVSDDLQSPSSDKSSSDGPDCAICLQTCVHPVQLPCLHIFCFLCAKGAIKNSRRCAMCRSDVPPDYLDHPLLLNEAQLEREMAVSDGYQWFYEGRNGWWKYDERTAAELEAAFCGGLKHAELLVAGYRYVVDFETMLQLRRSDPARRRRVKRDLASVPKKGVAGIRLAGAEEPDAAGTGLEGDLSRLAVTDETPAAAQTEPSDDDRL